MAAIVAAMHLLNTLGGVLRVVAGRALDLALPAACAGCRREGRVLCRDCLPALDARLDAEPGVPVGLPADLPVPLLQLEWCAPFTGVTRRAVLALKYDGERRLAPLLGAAVARRWRRAAAGGDLLLPVPGSPDRVRERGYDQAALIAHEAGRALGLPVLPTLERVRATAAQYDVDRAERAANLRVAFRIGRDSGIQNRWVVLVDDVVTTGATLAACATTALAAGALGVSAVTVARER